MAWEPEHPTPHENGFHLARIAHGLMGQHGINPRSIRPHTAARRIDAMLRDHGKAQHGVVEALAASWHRVGVPDGYEPFPIPNSQFPIPKLTLISTLSHRKTVWTA